MSAAGSRRGFLRGLTTLPLIGGGVSLIGQPTAVAEPVSDQLLYTYMEWLSTERRVLCHEVWPGEPNADRYVPQGTGATGFHFPDGVDWKALPGPSTRAALVLSAVGCDWRGKVWP
ncbi:hypothetical protein [Methylobacterium sp. J-070]|uniref:hypothetical protein n=1 Tax=Methylobacterium sp. J-070 TaxID=2836650 RepID=UPI001FB92D59|nr:hypothetical protein [Methylobacterium sp. J-070]MCJ2051241.1 hypothetical protein [Methylobacterium sp. J-070]